MKIIDNNTAFISASIIILLIFLIRIPVMSRPKQFTFHYSAQTRYEDQDHNYTFNITLLKNGYYRCYIERAPFLFGRKYSRYTINYAVDKNIGKSYILSNAKIHSVSEAKDLCAEWGNYNQFVIDSHRLNF